MLSNKVAPVRLVMIKLRCPYCGCNLNDGAYFKGVSYRYGILHCAEHSGHARHDIQDYMNSTGVARIGDVLEDTNTAPFFATIQDGIYVRRSNGTIDSGWKLLNDPVHSLNILQKQADGWVAQFYKGDSIKGVCLNTIFAIPENCKGSPEENEANARAAVTMRKWGKLHPELFGKPPVE